MIRRMMEKDAANRPQSALELRREINECLAAGNAEEPEADSPADHTPAEPPPLPPQKPAETGRNLEAVAGRSFAHPKRADSRRDVAHRRGTRRPTRPAIGGRRFDQRAAHSGGRHPFFGMRPPIAEIRERLHQRVTAWPAFDLINTPTEAPTPSEAADPSQMTTIIPGGDSIGDKAQQLARLIYELLGGVAGSRYVPLASLGEAGNTVLQRATVVGLGGYPTLRWATWWISFAAPRTTRFCRLRSPCRCVPQLRHPRSEFRRRSRRSPRRLLLPRLSSSALPTPSQPQFPRRSPNPRLARNRMRPRQRAYPSIVACQRKRHNCARSLPQKRRPDLPRKS